MKGSFFREFFYLKNDVSEDIKNSKNGNIERRFSDNAVLCVKLIWTYMMSCKWHNTERTKKLMTYINMKDSVIAEKLKISSNTVRSHKSKYSAALYKRIGGDCFDIIYSGDERKLSLLIRKLRCLVDGYEDIHSFVPERIIDAVMLTPRESDKVYEINECKKEMMYLARFSMIDMARSFDNLDEDRLAFLLEALMDANPHTDQEFKEKLLSFVLIAEDTLKERCNLL